MIKVIIVSLLVIVTLQARQNPFFPSKGEVDIPYTSNSKTTLPPLKRAAITVPSHARVIKKVTVEYINLDGTTSTTSIKLNNSIDWYLPIFITQSMGEIKTKDKKTKVTKPKKNSSDKYEEVFNLGFITFYKKDKEFRIATKDFLVRDFLLTKPHRIVLDFQKDLNVKSKVKNLNTKYFKKISFGVHEHYYRVVLELDGHYRYTKKRQKKGYSLFLR